MLKLFCLAVAVVPICLAGCSRDRQAVGSSSEHHHLSISIDPRMELLSVVQILSDYGQRTGLITQYDLSYKKDVATYFAPYKDHPAVKSFRELSSYPYSFRFSTPPNTMLYLSDPPDLKVVSEIPKVIYSLAGGKAKLNEFLEELRDFAKASSFTSFFAAHQDFYSRIVSGADAQLGGVDVVASLEDYFGTKQQDYNMIIVPLLAGNFGCTRGQDELYSICGPDSLSEDTPYVKGVRDICWHEFGHSFVNPVAAKFLTDISEYMPLFNAIANKMYCMGYETLEGYVDEHVLRAVNVRLVDKYLGAAYAQKAIRGHRSVGFVYVEALANKLAEYESQREKYPTFESFFPQLVAQFGELSKENLGDSLYTVSFTGTIRSVVCDYRDIFVVPTHEGDPVAQEAIRKHVEKMRDKYHKGSLILTDDDALTQNMSHHTLMVFGTTDGNSWLRTYKDSLRFQVKADSIVVDGTPYHGDHLRLIAACRNPQQSDKGVTVYTAVKAEDIPGSYTLPFNWAEYVVANGSNVVTWGNYRKSERQQAQK